SLHGPDTGSSNSLTVCAQGYRQYAKGQAFDLSDGYRLIGEDGRPGDSMKILLADDQDLVRDSLVTLISAYAPDSEVIAVNSVDAALGLLRRGTRYDIAVLDLHMPGMNGLAAAASWVTKQPK
ncbi:MAG TPA: response regulator, partial [Terriglobales bacterium]|nr:response regulator [Terriglobales bacterium]